MVEAQGWELDVVSGLIEELKAFWVNLSVDSAVFSSSVKYEEESLFCNGSVPIDLMKGHLRGLK